MNHILRLGVLSVLLTWGKLAFCSEIHQAILFNDLAEVKTLLDTNPALVNSRQADGKTPLHLAIIYGHKEMIDLLLTNNAEVSIQDAAALGDLEKVKALLATNPVLANSKDNSGMTPLQYAAFYDHEDMADLLLASNADVNAKDIGGNTALRIAELQNHRNMAELLSQHGGQDFVAAHERRYIPGLEPASQSNVTVTVLSMFSAGDPCPAEYTNLLSNTNLFTAEEQKMIGDALAKYKNVTTNSGPPGTVLVNSYQTNLIIPPLHWLGTNRPENVRRTNQIWVAHFQYTNSDAQEEIQFGVGISSRFRDKSNDGYNVSITWVGSGSLLTFSEVKHDSGKGLLVRFDDLHSQGTTWDYRHADFSGRHLEEYLQTTNGMLLGRWLMWNPQSGGLILEAESKEPYDWNNHRMKLP